MIAVLGGLQRAAHVAEPTTFLAVQRNPDARRGLYVGARPSAGETPAARLLKLE